MRVATSWFTGLSSAKRRREKPASGGSETRCSSSDTGGASSAGERTARTDPRWIGLVQQAWMPASRASSIGAYKPSELMSTRGIARSSGSALMARARARPSCPGINRSMSTRSNGRSCSLAMRSSRSAWGPSADSSAERPQIRSCSASMVRWVALSSTTSTRLSGIGAAAGPCGEASSSLTVNQKVLPTPGSLSTPISPPMRVVRRRQMASPRPVPPYLRVVEASAWEKGSNRR